MTIKLWACQVCRGITANPDQCRDCQRRLCAECYATHPRPCDGAAEGAPQ
jgi:hypothetical protein